MPKLAKINVWDRMALSFDPTTNGSSRRRVEGLLFHVNVLPIVVLLSCLYARYKAYVAQNLDEKDRGVRANVALFRDWSSLLCLVRSGIVFQHQES